MSDNDKTRVISKRTAKPVVPLPPPVVVDGRIVFHCPKGHRLMVAVAHAGKRGRCDRPNCGEMLVVPSIGTPEAEAIPEAEAAVPDAEAAPEMAAAEPGVAAEDDAGGGPPADGGPAAAGWDFNFGSAGPAAQSGDPLAFPDPSGGDAPPPTAEHPTARLAARLWDEREHGGIVELHLTGGSVIVPEWYEKRWSRGTHGLFASPGPNNTVTLTAVAWETVQKIVVRQLPGVPDGMFE